MLQLALGKLRIARKAFVSMQNIALTQCTEQQTGNLNLLQTYHQYQAVEIHVLSVCELSISKTTITKTKYYLSRLHMRCAEQQFPTPIFASHVLFNDSNALVVYQCRADNQ